MKEILYSIILSFIFLPSLQSKVARIDEWKLAAESDLIILATIEEVSQKITVNVSETFKTNPSFNLSKIQFKFFSQKPALKKLDFNQKNHRKLPQFKTGETWILFLKTNNENEFVLSHGTKFQIKESIQVINDYKQYSRLNDQQQQCRFLVGIVTNKDSPSVNNALRKLQDHNLDQNIDLLKPLGQHKHTVVHYISLLSTNNNRKALQHLKPFLKSNNEVIRAKSLMSLMRKDPQNQRLSKELSSYLKDPSPLVRKSTIFVLRYRDYYKVRPMVIKMLDDPDQNVIKYALSWSWNSLDVKNNPNLLDKFIQLSDHQDKDIRYQAARALVSTRQVKQLYLLLSKYFFDSSYSVRRSIDLSLLFEKFPIQFIFKLYWPSLFLFVIYLMTRSNLKRSVILLVAAFVFAIISGWIVGETYANNPFFCSLFIMPALTIPLFVLLDLFFFYMDNSNKLGQIKKLM